MGFLFAVRVHLGLRRAVLRIERETCMAFVLQFLTFSERLSNVNIDIIHRIDRTGSYAEVRIAIVVIFCSHITSRYAP